MASIAADAARTRAPSRVTWRLQTPLRWATATRDAIELWLEAERDQLPLWLPVMLGLGVTLWFALPLRWEWQAAALAALAFAAVAAAFHQGGRANIALSMAGIAVGAGIGLAWWRAERVALPVLARPAVVKLRARVERVEPLPARALVRLRLTPLAVLPAPPSDDTRRPPQAPPMLPPNLRVNLADADAPAGIARGAIVELGARLMPPQVAGVPGAYDYSRLAWFDGIGASGRGYAPVTLVTSPPIPTMACAPG